MDSFLLIYVVSFTEVAGFDRGSASFESRLGKEVTNKLRVTQEN